MLSASRLDDKIVWYENGVLPGELLGTIWNDVNGDGTQDGEPGIDGVGLTLYLDDGNGRFEPGGQDPAVGDPQVTAGGGDYRFAALDPGDYWVEVDYSTVPLSNFVPTWGKKPSLVTLAAGQDRVTDFGFRQHTGPFTLTTADDEDDGDYTPDDISLREALLLAGILTGDDVIQFDAGLTGATIRLAAALGQLEIDSNVDVQGPAAGSVTVDAAGNSRVFYIPGGVTAAISNLNITGGGWTLELGGGGGIRNKGTLTISNGTISGNVADHGGGIFNEGDLTLINSLVERNSAEGDLEGGTGGGIYSSNFGGTLTITNSAIFRNWAGRGGGIFGYGTLTITNSLIAENIAADAHSGGIFSYGTLTISDSTISGNTAQRDGGGIFSPGNLTITNSTISGNSAQRDGGGIYNWAGTLTIVNTTVSGNSAQTGNGGGIWNDSSGIARLDNTIVAGNSPDDVFGPLDPVSSHNLVGGNPMLGPLAENGGPTPTHALLPGSPAIDTGSNDWAIAARLTLDQRGFRRFIDGDSQGSVDVDIGAFEFGSTSPATVAGS